MEFPGNFIGTQNTANTNYLSGVHSLYEVGQGVSDGTWPTNYKINQSLRFQNSTSSYLTRTVGDGNQTTFTVSGWYKKVKSPTTYQNVWSSQTSGSDYFVITIGDYTVLNESFRIQCYNGTEQFLIRTSAVHRDYNQWYHFTVAMDTTQPEESDRAKIYINGELITEFNNVSYPTQNLDTRVNGTSHNVGTFNTSQQFFDGYIAEINFIDGLALDASYFGFTHPTTKKWLPKKYTGEYGAMGYHLDFAGTNTGTGAVGTVGEDKSGNGNHFTSNGIASHDVVPDSPTNNFATFNTTWRNYISGRTGLPVYKEGNLKADGTGASDPSDAMTEGTLAVPISGKWYFEVVTYGDTMVGWGVPFEGAASDAPGYNTRGFGLHKDGYVKYNSLDFITTGLGNISYSGQIVRVFLDLDNFQITFGRDGTWGTTDSMPALGNYDSLIPIFRTTNAAADDSHVNFGQDATFAGAKTPTQVYTDANGLGKFYYEPPAGALALCSENIDKINNRPTTYVSDETNKHIITYHDGARISKFSPYATDGYSFTGVSTKELNISKDAFTFGTGSFSFECWAYPDAHDGTNYQVIFDSRAAATAHPLVLGITQNGYPYWYNGSEYAGSIKTNPKQWNHIVYARDTSEGVLKMYLNGTQVYSSTSFNSTNLSGTTTGTAVIGQGVQNIAYIRGHLADVRVVKGSSAYDLSGTTISVPTKPLEVITNTSLLISSTKNRFLDLSTNAYDVVTDGPEISDFSPYSPDPNTVTQDLSIAGGSFQFDGLPDKLQVPDSNDWNPGALDFTIEGWYYLTASGSFYYLWGTGGSDGNEDFALRVNTTNTITAYLRNSSGTVVGLASTNTVVNNVWNHIALERYNNVIKIYLNGVAESNTYDASSWTGYNSETGFSVGAFGNYTSAGFWNGYIADFRFVKGAAVYQGNFTPPTAPLTQTSKTKLLLQPYSKVKQSGSVYKNIGGYNTADGVTLSGVSGREGKRLILEGNTKVVDISPYKKGDDIGSFYLDGDGSYIYTETSVSDFYFPSGTDFTIEFWQKAPSSGDSFRGVFGYDGSGNYKTYYRSGGTIDFYYTPSGTGPNNAELLSTSNVFDDKWHHIAITRASGHLRMFIDGTLEDNEASPSSANAGEQNQRLHFGGQYSFSDRDYRGLFTDLRVIKGQALYTSSFTSPKYPFTSDKYVTDGTDQSATGPSTTTTYTVTVASGTKYDGTTGNRYVIDGEPFETVTLHRGSTYRFDVSDSSFGSNAHPFRFSSNENNSPSAAYTTGVTVSGDGGSAGAYVEIVVANDAPDNLYYYCTNHSGMGGTIKVEGGRTITTDSVVLHIQPGKKEQKSEVFEFASFIKNNYSGTTITLANNGYSVSSSGSPYESVHSSFSVSSGKWYVEASGTGSSGAYVGVQEANTASPAPTYNVTLSNLASQGIGLWTVNGQIYGGNGTSAITSIQVSGTGSALASTDVVAMAIDMDASPKTVQWLVNNTRVITVKLGSTEYIAADGTTGTATATFADIDNLYVTYNGGTTNTRTGDWNFGQDPTILGNVTPSGGTNADNGFPDEDGNGSFRYAPPAGYKAMGRLQKPAQVVSDAGQHPEKHFNTVLYEGNGGTQSITGLDFKPDFVWIKSRTSATSHGAYDSVRGPLNAVFPDDTSAEVTTGKVSSFDQNGFSLSGAGNENTAGNDYVAWCWKAGGDPVPNTDGTIPSLVSVNKDAGFSIVKFNSGAAGNQTVGHGLTKKPDMIFFKGLVGSGWFVYHNGLTDDSKYLYLHDNFSESYLTQNSRTWGGRYFDNNVISYESDYTATVNAHYISYCWHSVPGFSKFGSYTGNASGDGPFIYTGFKPAWFFVKNIESSTSWYIYDSKRDGPNPTGLRLFANIPNAEGGATGGEDFDFLSNGVKVRYSSNQAFNANGQTIIYAAFAEAPFTRTSAK